MLVTQCALLLLAAHCEEAQATPHQLDRQARCCGVSHITLTIFLSPICRSILWPPVLSAGVDVNGLVKYAALSADVVGEEAIDLVLHNTYPDKEHLWAPAGPYRRLKFVPFNPVDKFTMAVVQEEGTGRVMRLMKGAPQVGRCLLVCLWMLSASPTATA
jgi:hypothetical protein